MARETLEIVDAGRYRVNDQLIYIKNLVDESVAGTISYSPEASIPSWKSDECQCSISVANESTLAGARRLASKNPVVLNFASAKNPGGGFLGGSQAQEETLARSSALYASLTADMKMYEFHRERKDPMYSHWMKYSPRVPIFRDDEGNLLSEPYCVSFVTCPAVNAGVVLDRDKSRGQEIQTTMRERASRVLAVMAAQGHRHLVLGAWGCGVFRNEPEDVATIFHDLLVGQFENCFTEVLFSIYDSKRDKPALTAFSRVFSQLNCQ